jgi:hypothetical protein
MSRSDGSIAPRRRSLGQQQRGEVKKTLALHGLHVDAAKHAVVEVTHVLHALHAQRRPQRRRVRRQAQLCEDLKQRGPLRRRGRQSRQRDASDRHRRWFTARFGAHI